MLTPRKISLGSSLCNWTIKHSEFVTGDEIDTENAVMTDRNVGVVGDAKKDWKCMLSSYLSVCITSADP